jgi:outer membrane protein assembly factor BamE (lipoprotein component of BamABCDE complex)
MNRNSGSSSTPKFALAAVAAAVLLATQTGCETAAHRLNPKAAQAIKPGVTTRQEVLRDFGTPHETTCTNGRTLLIYERNYYGSLTDLGPFQIQPTTCVDLSVLCDPSDRVLRTHYSAHQIDIRWNLGSATVGSLVNEKTMAKIRPNSTTRQEVVALLGEPLTEALTLDGELVFQWYYWERNFVGGQWCRIYRVFFNDSNVATAVTSDLYSGTSAMMIARPLWF